MKQRTIDVRGEACPEPVMRTKEALDDLDLHELTVLVDNEAAAENVSRMGRHLGCEVRLETVSESEIRVVLNREGRAVSARTGSMEQVGVCCAPRNAAVLVPSDGFGRGDPDLGRALLLAFLGSLKSVSPRPKALI